jgi:undecaprenyl-diphosphatase
MDYLKAVLLGIVQGLTEFLPVSSSGHLVLAERLLDIEAPGYLDIVFLHLGTWVATVVFFRRDIVTILAAASRAVGRGRGDAPGAEADRQALRLAGLLVVGTAVTGILGMTALSFLDEAFESLLVVGGALLGTAVLLAVSGSPRFRFGTRRLDRVTLRDAGIVGVAQAAALVPGLSRSGATIAAGMMSGLERRTAARFSFLLSIPTIAAANGVEWLRLEPGDLTASGGLSVLLVGAVASGIAGFLALGLLLRILGRTSLRGFAYYCGAAGALTLAVASILRTVG